MNRRIVAMTVEVSADGSCAGSEALFNGQRDKVVLAVQEELTRQKADAAARERALIADCDARLKLADRQIAEANDRACDEREKRFELLRDRKQAVERALLRRRSLVWRAIAALENGWAKVYAIIVNIPEIGEKLGLWVDLRKEGNREANCKRAA